MDYTYISNSKKIFNSRNNMGNAITIGDNKTAFLKSFGEWLIKWQDDHITNCEKFRLSTQTASALIRTVQCHAALVEELLHEDNYNFVLTSRFQSDPLERRYGQYTVR